MPAPEVEICSQALVMIGARPIATLTGDSAEQLACETLYSMTVNDLLSRYRWRFASRQVQLERLAAEPLARFSAKYQLPSDVERCEVYALTVNDRRIEFDRFESHVYCDAGADDEVIAEVKVVPSEAYWPSYFNTLVALQLASVLAVTLAEDAQKATLYEGKAMRQFAQAKNLDAQTRTARKLPVGALRRYHGGGPRGGIPREGDL